MSVLLLRPWAAVAGEAPAVRATLRPGELVVSVTSGSKDLSIAQVFVNDAFVGFRATQTAVPPHGSTRLVIDYPWIKGETYELGLLTATGEILQEDIEDAGSG